MANISTYLADKLLDAVLSNTSYTLPTTVYAAAMTAAPTAAGGGTEVSGGSYARQAITWGSAASNAKANSAAVTFPTATASWGTVVDLAIYDAATAGNLLFFGALGTSEAIASTNVLNFPIGNISVSLT